MREISRRAVMALGAGTVGSIAIATLSAPPALGAPAPLGTTVPAFTPSPAAGPPVRSHFIGHIGETFLATTDAGSTPLILADVLDLTHAAANDENRFSLVFTAPAGAERTAAIYTITHPAAPAASLYLSPIGDPELRELQALVNRPQ